MLLEVVKRVRGERAEEPRAARLQCGELFAAVRSWYAFGYQSVGLTRAGSRLLAIGIHIRIASASEACRM